MKTIGLIIITALLGVCMPADAQFCRNNIRASTPASDFVLNGNGTTIHVKTGLTWMRCALGQIWDGSSCTGSYNWYNWQQALQAANVLNADGGYGGWHDWRLPNINELHSIIEDQCYDPTIRASIFPNTPSSDFWSASPGADGSPYHAWIVDFYFGYDWLDGKEINDYHAVRLVRGGQSFDPLTVAIAQSPLSGSAGDYFVQWGDGFSPNSTATLHVKKPNGTEYPTQPQAIDAKGHFSTNYKIPVTKPIGTYTWWVVDGKNGKQSEAVAYQITPLVNVATIYGKLHSNSSGGAALSGAKVSTGIKATTTASDGSFTLTKIPAGNQVINFSKTGYQPFSITIPVPSSGSYNMGNRWLVQNGLVKPTIAQAPMSGLPGTTFIQWGTGFTPNGTATLHFKKPDNTEYPPVTLSLDSKGHLETPYRTPMNKPAGIYTWWAIDNASNKTSNTVAYTVEEAVNTCKAPTQYDNLLKISNATCRDKWNLTIFYKERYMGYFALNQKYLDEYINGTLNTNKKINIAIDGISSIFSIKDIPSLKNKDIVSLVNKGSNLSTEFLAKIIDNEYASIWTGAIDAAVETVEEDGNPLPMIQYAITNLSSTFNNLYAAVGVSSLTKRSQELEIAKQFLFIYYRYGSRMSLVATSYGLPENATTADIVKVIGDQISASYNADNVISLIRTDMNIVAMKQTEYSK